MCQAEALFSSKEPVGCRLSRQFWDIPKFENYGWSYSVSERNSKTLVLE
jgi:hypothetical protein